MLRICKNFIKIFDEIFETPDSFEKFVKNCLMYSYLWNFRVNRSENFENEICTEFTENFENILGKLWGRFSKSIRKFHEKFTKFWVCLSKYLKNSLKMVDLYLNLIICTCWLGSIEIFMLFSFDWNNFQLWIMFILSKISTQIVALINEGISHHFFTLQYNLMHGTMNDVY